MSFSLLVVYLMNYMEKQIDIKRERHRTNKSNIKIKCNKIIHLSNETKQNVKIKQDAQFIEASFKPVR